MVLLSSSNLYIFRRNFQANNDCSWRNQSWRTFFWFISFWLWLFWKVNFISQTACSLTQITLFTGNSRSSLFSELLTPDRNSAVYIALLLQWVSKRFQCSVEKIDILRNYNWRITWVLTYRSLLFSVRQKKHLMKLMLNCSTKGSFHSFLLLSLSQTQLLAGTVEYL